MASSAAMTFEGTERFEVRGRIGAGAMGVVYEAFDRQRDMVVALKVLRSNAPASIYRFKQEFRALAGICHPNLVALHELHAVGDAWFFTMERLVGVELATYVGGAANDSGARRPLDHERLRSCLAQLAQGVHALHSAGRLHRDIKPSNLLVTEEPRLVLLDFGVIAEIGGASARGLAEAGLVIGTPAYMAPEQARGEAVPASDWYAVGVLLYELLTGTLPFRGAARAILFDKGRGDAQPVRQVDPGAPADLATLCDQLLRRDPTTRPSAAEILRRLDVAASPPSRIGPRPDASRSALIGRHDAMAILRGALDDAQRGDGRVVHVSGESGMGKSTLVRCFLDDAERDGGAVVLAGRCYQQESVPYAAVDDLVDALARHLARLPRHDADAALPRDVGLLAKVFPVFNTVEAIVTARRRGSGLPEPHELRRRAFAALRELVTRLAEARTLVLFIDDVQWGDADSAPILEELMRPPDPPALLLILAYRAEDAGRSVLLRALLGRRERLGEGAPAIEVSLGPLSGDDSRDLATALLGQADPVRAAAIAAESGGVPFFVHELALAGVDGARRGPSPRLDEVVAARVAALSSAERLVLELTAQAGKPIAERVIASASRLPEAELDRALATLASARLVRRVRVDDGALLECYHDRIREAVIAGLAGRRRDHHARLAAALAATAAPDLEALVVHCQGAGDRAAAADYALRAAEQASRALAFDRAAQLYATSLELGVRDAAAIRAVQTALGDALASSGRGGAAAEAYMVAALDAPAAEALELRRRAASQYLRSGRVDSGLRVLDQVLGEVGGRRPGSPRRAMLALGWRRARLRIRGLGFARRDVSQISPYDLARLDVLRSAATDLGMVDLIVGADFATRQLLLALELGEPSRVARALTVEAMFLAAQGAPMARRTDAVLATAQALVAELDDPELPAWLAAARGLADYEAGRFRRAAAHSREAVRWLQEACVGVLWERGGVEVQLLWSLFYLGELRELTARVDALVEQARIRGNRFDLANLCTGLPALAWVVADRPAQGRLEVEHAMAAWSPRGFHLQHYYQMLALASFDLYDDLGVDAGTRIDDAWPALVRSRLLMSPSVAIEAQHLRGRAAIAIGDPAAVARPLRALAAWRGNPWADAMAALLDAGARTDRADAIAALDVAIERCGAGELAVFARAARRRRGELTGGTEGDAMVERADRELTGQGVRDPVRLARLLVPVLAIRAT